MRPSPFAKFLAILETTVPDPYGQALYALGIGLDKLSRLTPEERERIYRVLDGARDVDFKRLGSLAQARPSKKPKLRVIEGGKRPSGAGAGLRRFARDIPELAALERDGRPILNLALGVLARRVADKLRAEVFEIVSVVNDDDEAYGWEPKETPPASEDADCSSLDRHAQRQQAWLDSLTSPGAVKVTTSIVVDVDGPDSTSFAGAIVSLEADAKGCKAWRIVVKL